MGIEARPVYSLWKKWIETLNPEEKRQDLGLFPCAQTEDGSNEYFEYSEGIYEDR